MSSEKEKGMPAGVFVLLFATVVSLSFIWTPAYTVMSPIDLISTIGLSTIPLLGIRFLWTDHNYKNAFCLCFLSMAIYLHPVVVTHPDEMQPSYSAQPGDDIDYEPTVATSYEKEQAYKAMLFRDAFDRRLSYAERTLKGKKLSKLMRREAIESLQRYQPWLYWMYPPSLAMIFLGCLLYFFGFRFPKPRD